MLKLKPKELKNLVGIHYKSKIPLFVYGGFGIGKSAIIREVAKDTADKKGKEYVEWNRVTKDEKFKVLENPEKYFVLIDERLSQYEPSDLKGLPKFDDKNEHLEWSIPLWLVFLTKPKADGILFFDEMNLAVPSVLASCYQIFHDREINEQKFSEDILIVGAGNRLEDKANTYDVPLPLRDRKSEVELVVDNEEWIDWALKNGINRDIISFLKFRGDYLLKVNDDRDNKSITPRGWERTSKLLEHAKDKDARVVISGSIGDGVALELVAFLKLQNKIDIDAILNNPEKVKDVKEIDLKYSLIAGLSKKFEEKPNNLEKLLGVCPYLDAEFGVLLIKFLKGINESYVKKNAVNLPVWKKNLAGEYGKYLL